MQNLTLVNTKPTHLLSVALLCALIFAGCEGGDDPMRIGVQITPGGETVPPNGGEPAGQMMNAGTPVEMTAGAQPAGDTPAGMNLGGMSPGGGVIECNEVGPDEAVFANSVGPSLITTCASGACHAPNTRNGLILPVSDVDFSPPLAGDLLTESLEASMAFVTPGRPENSRLLDMAYDGHGFRTFYAMNSPEYTQLSDWISDMILCEEITPTGGDPMGGDPMGGDLVGGAPAGGDEDTSVFCQLLPNGDPQNRADGLYYQQFENEINELLTSTCANGGGCHESSTRGFWLQPQSDPCSVPANFLLTQAYINFAEPDASPMLSAAYDPAHSGYMIFVGRSDPDFITLRNWVLLAFE